MKRVVVTGMGIVCSIGNDQKEVCDSLQEAKSGIVFSEKYKKMGLRSQICGNITLTSEEIRQKIDRQNYRFMGEAAAFSYLAMKEAIADAQLDESLISHEKTGLITGSGGASNADIIESADLLRNSGIRKVGPYRVPRTMSSTTSACLATSFACKGTVYSISSACATSSHCIGASAELIQQGKQNIMFAGGGEELHWSLAMLFDSMNALSTKYNEIPEKASRAFDVDRDGFVIAGGGGILVLEELEHARARGAKIYAELVGYGATSDGFNMVQPSGEGAVRCLRQALSAIDEPVDYINTHGTSTPVGDVRELEAIREVFTDYMPACSSTKSLTGHSLGAAGVQEAIYTLLMLEHGFIAPSINIDTLVSEASECNIVQSLEKKTLNVVMSNSFGFGGANASLVFRKL